jgi:hypothetical protein
MIFILKYEIVLGRGFALPVRVGNPVLDGDSPLGHGAMQSRRIRSTFQDACSLHQQGDGSDVGGSTHI